jgi:hypothetical protein
VPKFNIKPRHKEFQSIGTDSTHTSLTSPYNADNKAFVSFADMGTTSSHTSLETSGYQYYGSLFTFVQFASSEPVNVADILTVYITTVFTEPVPCTDQDIRGFSEGVNVADVLTVKVTKIFTEPVDCADLLSVYNLGMTEAVNVADVLTVRVTNVFTEPVNVADDVTAYTPFDSTDSTKIECYKAFSDYDSTKITSSVYLNSTDSTNIAVTPYNLVAVTSASSVSNPFEPTIIIGGITYVTNPSSAPSAYTPDVNSYYVQWVNAGLGTTSYCSTTAFDFTLDYNGGSFTTKTIATLGSRGQQINIFGLTGTITDDGETISASEIVYDTEGIFGTPNLNKQFNLVTFGGSQHLQFLNTNVFFGFPNVNSNTTAMGMAQAIAAACGITLSWRVPDAPYSDSLSQSGLTGAEALNSIAGTVGATVRWNGNSSYVVAYPDYFAGEWHIPDSRLVHASGMSYKNHQDLGYGISGAGVIGIPVYSTFDPSTKTLPTSPAIADPQGSSPQVQRLGTISKFLTEDDPPVIFDLPQDVDQVYCQVLLAPGKSTAGSTTAGLREFCTTDPSVWFVYDISGYRTVANVGGALIPQVRVDNNTMVNNSEVEAGNFIMYMACTRRSLQGDFNQAEGDAQADLRDVLNRAQSNLRFIKTYSGTITCAFFGSIPMPGMWTSVSYCGKNVEGIITSVSVNSGRIMTITVEQYVRVNLLDQKLAW